MKMPFKIERDFEPVGLIASVPIVLVANTEQPFKTLQEFIAATRKANPGKLSYSSPGNGTPQHLAGEVFAKLSKTEMLHVPYRGTGPAIADLVGGQVQISFAHAGLGDAASCRRASCARWASPGRSAPPLMPDLPTFGEAGLQGYDAGALVQPAGAGQDAEAGGCQAERGAGRSAEDARGREAAGEARLRDRTSTPSELRPSSPTTWRAGSASSATTTSSVHAMRYRWTTRCWKTWASTGRVGAGHASFEIELSRAT